MEILKIVSDNIGYIVGILGGLGALWAIVKKPLESIEAELTLIRKENKEQTERLNDIDNDTGDILCAQLTREHDFYVNNRGWCSAADKARINDIYTKYRKRGRNHLSEHYMDEIEALPETKQRK